MHVIDVTDVTKRYGDVTALDGLSLSVEAGSTFGLLGTNGAGKTTLFKLLVGHTTPDGGGVDVAGRAVSSAGHDVRQDIGYLPEHAGFPAALSGREVLTFHARMRGLARGEREARIDEVLATVGLTDDADRAVEGYSNGMNRRLGLATTLLARPSVLLLDEPTAGLDPLGVATFHRIIRRLREERDLTVVLSSHVMAEVEELCDAAALLHDGRLRAIGDVADLRAATEEMLTVTLRAATEVAVPDILDRADRLDCTVRTTEDKRVDLACPREAVPELLAAVTNLDAVAGYEVTEPGLDRLFEQLVGDDRTEVATGESPAAEEAVEVEP